MTREESNFRYQEKLKEKFASHPEIRRIARHRHVPKHVYNARNERNAMLESRRRKYALISLLITLYLTPLLSNSFVINNVIMFSFLLSRNKQRGEPARSLQARHCAVCVGED